MRTVEFDAPIANPLPRIRRGPVLAEARTMGEVQRYLQAEAGHRQAIAAYQRLTEAGVDQPLSAP